jgi:tetratricopeptide (TPR) repeat protein
MIGGGPSRYRATMLVMAMACVADCATTMPRSAPTRVPGPPGAWLTARESKAGWRALIDGHDVEAAALFSTALAADPGDEYARFGRAALAFERGDVRTALFDNLALLEHAAGRPAPATEEAAARGDLASGPVIRAMAAGRLAISLDEFSGTTAEREDIEHRVMTLLGSFHGDWRTHFELTMLADEMARRRADPQLLARVAAQSGCLRDFRVMRPAGVLPHLDLDAPMATLPAGGDHAVEAKPWQRAVHAAGCRVSLPSFEGRSGAQRVQVEVDVAAASSDPRSGTRSAATPGAFDLVLEFSNEARLAVDGGPARKHGGEFQFGPRISVTHVVLAPGHHLLELRLATYGGSPELSLLLVPSPSAAAVPTDGDPDARLAAGNFLPALERERAAALALAALYVANRDGDTEASWRWADRLDAYPRFSLGRALQGTARRDDPSVPTNVARDRARARWDEALGVSPELARVRHSLAALDLEEERPRPAIDAASAAARDAPAWWLPPLTLYGAYRLRGLDFDAEQSFARATALGGDVCTVLEAALGRAEDRRDAAGEERAVAALARCPGGMEVTLERLRKRGELAAAAALLRRMISLAPEREALKMDLAATLLAAGKSAPAVDLLVAAVEPTDGEGQIRLADALLAAGQSPRAQQVLTAVAKRRPDSAEVNRAARALRIPLPLAPFRLDGRQVIRDFESSGRTYRAPAVVVLDRTVTRVFPGGAEMTLTHEIVRVQSKDAIEKWGEVSLPERAEILTLRTHKPDGTTREPEEVAGKESVSAADLSIGDYVEKETLELHAPDEAFVADGGFIGDRFFFQSFDAPLDRTEYVVVTEPTASAPLSVDARAGAPEAVESQAADGARITTFARQQVKQRFPESASVPAIETVPSVRIVRAARWSDWTRFLREQTYGTLKASWGLRAVAADVRRQAASSDPWALAAALVAWVGQRIEADEDLRETAAFTVARGRGNRVAVILAVARLLNLPADTVLARSRLSAEATSPTPVAELDDFADPLLRFQLPARSPGPSAVEMVYFDPTLKHAPLGYLPPGLDGAPIVSLESPPLGAGAEDAARFGVAHGRGDDGRAIELGVRLDELGGGRAEVVEELRGWPALEWAEVIDKLGTDRDKMRQDFEQRWLGVQFPGAVLNDLNIDMRGEGGRLLSSLAFPWSAPDAQQPGQKRVAASAPTLSHPYSVVSIRLKYSFSSQRLASGGGRTLRVQPTFFRTLPGRRYAAEPRRDTTLALGFDIPLEVRARIELPAGATVDSELGSRPPVTHPGGYRFVEERQVSRLPDGREVIQLRREERLPIMRVAPAEYPRVAEQLRGVDSAEQEEIRIALPSAAKVVR